MLCLMQCLWGFMGIGSIKSYGSWDAMHGLQVPGANIFEETAF